MGFYTNLRVDCTIRMTGSDLNFPLPCEFQSSIGLLPPPQRAIPLQLPIRSRSMAPCTAVATPLIQFALGPTGVSGPTTSQPHGLLVPAFDFSRPRYPVRATVVPAPPFFHKDATLDPRDGHDNPAPKILPFRPVLGNWQSDTHESA